MYYNMIYTSDMLIFSIFFFKVESQDIRGSIMIRKLAILVYFGFCLVAKGL